MTSRVLRSAVALIGTCALGASLMGFASVGPAKAQSTTSAGITLSMTAQFNYDAKPGDLVEYSYHLQNIGTERLVDVRVENGVGGASSPADLSPVTCPETVLNPGGWVDCWATYRVSQADLDAGHLTSTGLAWGSPTKGDPVASLPAYVDTPTRVAPSIVLTVKDSQSTSTRSVGNTVRYTYTVANTGNLTLRGVAVDGGVQAPSTSQGLSRVDCPGGDLTPGASVDCTATYTLSSADVIDGVLRSSPSARATAPAGFDVTSASESTVALPRLVQPAELTGTKYAIFNVNSRKALDINAQGEIVQKDYTATSRQWWTFTADVGSTPRPSRNAVNIRNVSTTQLLGVVAGAQHDGAVAVQWPDVNAADQSWSLLPTDGGYVTIVNNNSGKVLGIPAGSQKDGEKAVQWTEERVKDQQWVLLPVD